MLKVSFFAVTLPAQEAVWNTLSSMCSGIRDRSSDSGSATYLTFGKFIRSHCFLIYFFKTCFPGGSEGKESACNAGDQSLIPEWGRYPREGNGNPLQYSCLENPMDRGAWRTAVHRISKSRTRASY